MEKTEVQTESTGAAESPASKPDDGVGSAQRSNQNTASADGEEAKEEEEEEPRPQSSPLESEATVRAPSEFQSEPDGPEATVPDPGVPEHREASGETQEAELEREVQQRPAENEISEVEIPNVGRITVRADADGYNEEMMLTPAMQGVILAIAKARQTFDKEGPEAGLIKAFHEEYCRLYELSQEEATPQEDTRLQHALVFFFQNNAPKRVIERTLLEQFTDRNLSFDERSISIMREARSKLRLIKPEDMDMDEYLQWHEDYRMFRTVFVYLLTGLEHYQHGKMREALTYLTHAYETNSSLLKNGQKRGVEMTMITNYRRKCLTALNESASQLFCSGDACKVDEGVCIMDEAVIPCLHLMGRDPAVTLEDRDAMENIRSRWCCCLGRDMDDSLQVKLGEFLPRVLDCSAETVVLKDPPQVHVSPAHDLCSRLAAVMESIHNTTVVTVK